MLAKKTSKNQLTLPKAVADRFPGIEYFDIDVKENRIVLVPAKITRIRTPLEEIRGRMQKLGMREKDVGGAVKWARKRKS